MTAWTREQIVIVIEEGLTNFVIGPIVTYGSHCPGDRCERGEWGCAETPGLHHWTEVLGLGAAQWTYCRTCRQDVEWSTDRGAP